MTAFVPLREQRTPAPGGDELLSNFRMRDGSSGKNLHFLLLRRRLAHAVALGLAVAASDTLLAYPMLAEHEEQVRLSWYALLLLNNLTSFLALVAALTAIQVWLPTRRWRLPAMLLTVIAIGIGVAGVQSSQLWRDITVAEHLLYDDVTSLYLYRVWGLVALGGLLAVLYEWQARADQVIEAVRAAGIAGEIVERKILDSRLSSLKARVDPEFLYAVIARAQTLYGEKIDAAEQLLERLIEFLRASLPQSRELMVSIEQEVTLCRAYLELEKALRLDSFSYETKADAALAGSYFPPSVLLPLLKAVLPPHASPVRHVHFSITAERQPACVRIELTCHAVSPPPSREALEAASAALRAFFGDRVSVVAVPACFTGRTIRIEVPHVAT